MHRAKLLIMRFITPSNLFFSATTLALTCALFIQCEKNNLTSVKLDLLIKENHALLNQNQSLNSSIDDIVKNHDDIRAFQKFIALTVNKFDQSFVVSFSKNIKDENNHSAKDQVIFSNHKAHSEGEIFRLQTSSQHLAFDSAVLLGRALNILEIMSKTPSLMPAQGYISSSFGLRRDPFSNKTRRHKGIDIAALAGTPVYAPADGYVFTARFNQSFGNMIEIMHESGLHTRYGHLSEIVVKRGDTVKRGERIGSIGSTGLRSQGTHLHYEVRNEDRALNPAKFFVTSPAKTNMVF